MNMPKIMEEDIIASAVGNCAHRSSFFAKANERISNDLISGGIVQYWFNYLLDFELKALEDDPRKPQVFGMVRKKKLPMYSKYYLFDF